MKKIILFSSLLLFSCNQELKKDVAIEKQAQKPRKEKINSPQNNEAIKKSLQVNETTYEDIGNGLIVIDGDTLEKDCTCGDPSLHLK